MMKTLERTLRTNGYSQMCLAQACLLYAAFHLDHRISPSHSKCVNISALHQPLQNIFCFFSNFQHVLPVGNQCGNVSPVNPKKTRARARIFFACKERKKSEL